MHYDSHEILRGIVAFALEETRNRALEEAAKMVEDSYGWKQRNEKYLAATIRALKRPARSHLAEAKVRIGTIFALLPDQSKQETRTTEKEG